MGVAITIGTLLPTVAQAQFGFPDPPPPYRPAKDAKDLRSVLFNWTWYMGMLRGVDEHELITSLEYQGKGTIQVNGQPCTLTKYRVSTNYQYPGRRVQYTCTESNGQTVSKIEVVNGHDAWDEDTPGAEIVPGKGHATPMPNAVDERLIRLWASPQGAPKAAIASVEGVAPNAKLGANPGTLLKDGVEKAGQTSLAWENGKAVVTFPIPGVSGAIATATLNNKYMAERVVVKHAGKTTEFTYGDYQDWNNPLNKVDALYAGKIAESRNGAAVLDLTTEQTETGSVYVVMPVPASVRAAEHAAPDPQPVPVTPDALTASGATPRMPDGHPDLSGNWNSAGMNWRYGNRRCDPTQQEGCSRALNQTMDFEFEAPSRFGPSRPLYKPQYWDKVQQLDMWTNKDDPVMTCQPLGNPRQGPPRRIVQSANDIIFFYTMYADGGGGNNEFRIIPTDGRKHDEKKAIESTYYGYTVGNWQGDTLVLDSISFVDTTWLARGGFFHSDQMHVIEKLTRKGDQILYEVTVEDPEVLAEPWVMTPRVLTLSKFPDAGLITERANCEVYEIKDITSQIRH
ncbi:MAG TPA: hypothetical protein VFW44_22880 [Bryobacteraceae bacterium]|nr:hypothetical protein [Bryobacteraceae bacterium]